MKILDYGEQGSKVNAIFHGNLSESIARIEKKINSKWLGLQLNSHWNILPLYAHLLYLFFIF